MYRRSFGVRTFQKLITTTISGTLLLKFEKYGKGDVQAWWESNLVLPSMSNVKGLSLDTRDKSTLTVLRCCCTCAIFSRLILDPCTQPDQP